MRRAKIVCTIGPATETPEQLQALVDAGMDVARINRSHGKAEEHEAVISRVRKASARPAARSRFSSTSRAPRSVLRRSRMAPRN